MYEDQAMTSSSGALAAQVRRSGDADVRFSPLRQVSDELEVSMTEAHSALDQLEQQLAPISRGVTNQVTELKQHEPESTIADSEAVQRLNAVRNTVHQLTTRVRLLMERLDV